MTQEQPHQKDEGPLPRDRKAVDWWLQKWWGYTVIDENEPFERGDIDRLIGVNGGTAEELHLVNRNLQNAQLEWIKLQGADLREANLQGAHLQSADLQGADLRRANCQDAELGSAKLQGADLLGADFQRAHLIRTQLQGADLRGADLRGANLKRAHITPDTDLEDVKWGKNYISVLEWERDYEGAIALYRRLKEWYHYAGMNTVAGEFHYREREAARKAEWNQLRNELGELGRPVASAWKRLKQILRKRVGHVKES